MFTDRHDAGRRLADRLRHLVPEAPVVLGLPRGGVVVAAEVARGLDAPLDVLVVRKIGAPLQPELAIGAVIDGDPPREVWNADLVRLLQVDDAYRRSECGRQLVEARRRLACYRRERPAIPITGRTVIIVDDGIATGATAEAAISALSGVAARLVLAVPIAAPDTVRRLVRTVDEMVCLHAPVSFGAVGAFYGDFAQTSDEEVVALLAAARPAARS